jgi:hypothetical protein
MSQPIGKVLVALAAITTLVLVAALVLALRAPAPVAGPLPVPNAYDEFLKASTLVAGETADWPNLSPEKLRVTVATNAEALRLARAGFSHESRVPLSYSVTNMAGHMTDLANFKRLAHAFAAEGKLAELENRPGDAAKSYLDTIRFGHELSRGGVIIDSLVGIAVQAIGLTPLEKLPGKLDPKSCREIAASLEALESKREPAPVVFQQEKVWARRTFGWKTQILHLISFRQTQAAKQRFAARMATIQTRTRPVLVDLRSRATEPEHAARPKNP